MTDKEQLHFLLGYLEGLTTKETISPSDLGIVMNTVDSNQLFHEVSDDMDNEEEDGFYDGGDYDDDNHKESFGQYAGSYAQDVEGLSDDFINDVLEGDPDNYWNID